MRKVESNNYGVNRLQVWSLHSPPGKIMHTSNTNSIFDWIEFPWISFSLLVCFVGCVREREAIKLFYVCSRRRNVRAFGAIPSNAVKGAISSAEKNAKDNRIRPNCREKFRCRECREIEGHGQNKSWIFLVKSRRERRRRKEKWKKKTEKGLYSRER